MNDYNNETITNVGGRMKDISDRIGALKGNFCDMKSESEKYIVADTKDVMDYLGMERLNDNAN